MTFLNAFTLLFYSQFIVVKDGKIIKFKHYQEAIDYKNKHKFSSKDMMVYGEKWIGKDVCFFIKSSKPSLQLFGEMLEKSKSQQATMERL